MLPTKTQKHKLPKGVEKALLMLTNPLSRCLIAQMSSSILNSVAGVAECILEEDEEKWKKDYPKLAAALQEADEAFNKFEDSMDAQGITVSELLKEVFPELTGLIKANQQVIVYHQGWQGKKS